MIIWSVRDKNYFIVACNRILTNYKKMILSPLLAYIFDTWTKKCLYSHLYLIIFVLIAKCHKPSLYRLQRSFYYSFRNLKTAWNANFQMCPSTIERKCCMLQPLHDRHENIEGCFGVITRNSYWSHTLYQYWILTLSQINSVLWVNHLIEYMKVPAFHHTDDV